MRLCPGGTGSSARSCTRGYAELRAECVRAAHTGEFRYGALWERRGARAPAGHGGTQHRGRRRERFQRGLGGISGRAPRARTPRGRASDTAGRTDRGLSRRLPASCGSQRALRQWRLDGRSLRLEDRVSGSFRSAAARFHVHPQLAARMSGTNAVTLVAANGAEVRMSFEPAASVQVVASTWHPEFGVAEANSCVVARFAGDTLRTHVAWAPEP